MTERRRYLDDPYTTEITDMEQAQALLRRLAAHERSPLPQRLRSRLAAMVARLTAMRRELQRHPEQIAAERAQDDAHDPHP